MGGEDVTTFRVIFEVTRACGSPGEAFHLSSFDRRIKPTGAGWPRLGRTKEERETTTTTTTKRAPTKEECMMLVERLLARAP
jgi:hypothetical protein